MITEKQALAVIPKNTFLDYYVQYARQCTDSHLAFHLVGGLITLAQTLPVNFGIPLGDSLMRGNLFSLVVGPSGDRKTAALKICQHLLESASVGYIAEHPGSPQACADEIRDHPQQVILYEEFGALLSQAERGYLVPLKTLLTQVYDGGDLGRSLVKRRGQGSVKDVRVSLFGAVTPEYLGRYTESTDWEGGFFNRFLFMYSTKERDFDMQPHRVEGRSRLVERLQLLTSLDSFAKGRCLGYPSSIRPMWREWYLTVRKRAEQNPDIRGALARADSLAHKIALVLAWDYGDARSGEDWYIQEEQLVPAIQIVELHIASLMDLSTHIAPSKVIRDRITVLKCVSNRPISTGSVITKSRVGLQKYVNEILLSLEAERIIQRVETPDNKNNYWILAEPDSMAREDNVVALFKPAPALEVASREDEKERGVGLEAAPDLE